MTDGTERRRTSPAKIGLALVVVSYVLWAPALLFAALAAGAGARLWGCLAAATYAAGWILFLAGILLAGPQVARSSRRRLPQMFRRGRTPGPATDSGAAPAAEAEAQGRRETGAISAGRHGVTPG